METKNPLNTSEIELFDYSEVMPSMEQYEKNENNYGSVKDLLVENATDENGVKLRNYISNCFICNRPLDDRKAAWVHLSTQGGLIPVALEIDSDTHPDYSQGWFPVGASCASKIKAKYRKASLK